MFRKTLLATALAAVCATPLSALAANDHDLAEIRDQIKQMKASYEARLQSLEQRLQEAQAKLDKPAAPATLIAPTPAPAAVAVAEAAPPPASAPAASPNGFNPAISLILTSTYANLSQDPERYRLQGFIPSGPDAGPGKRGFSLGESELTFSANVDHLFAGQLTVALSGDNTAGVEESFVQTTNLANGLNVKLGRFFSGLGYQNGQHAHTWDFVDAPLAYQAFLGGQYATDGVQAKWLAPTERFFEAGLELGNGSTFPGNDTNRNGLKATTVFAHLGDDIGESASWRAGLSYLRTSARDRNFEDNASLGSDAPVTNATNAFTGRSSLWVADAIYKWAPNGNGTHTNLKLQGEYFRRTESGTLVPGAPSTGLGGSAALADYDSRQSGWYVQGVYQFQPAWRVGLRYERLSSGSQNSGLGLANFAILSAFTPSRTGVMFDYNPSEFTRLRVQLARSHAQPGTSDNQIFLQYIMSLGTHGAHSF
jgi:hypothetical protein